VAAGTEFKVRADAADPEGDALVWRWAVLPEKAGHDAGRRLRMPAAVEGAITSTEGDLAQVKAPKQSGKYRLHVWVSDGNGHAATANASFEVK